MSIVETVSLSYAAKCSTQWVRSAKVFHAAHGPMSVGHVSQMIYGVMAVAVLLAPQEISYWLENFSPNIATVTAHAALAPVILLHDALGLGLVHDAVQAGFHQLIDTHF